MCRIIDIKREFLIGLFLLTVFCVAPSVFAQKTGEKKKKEKPNFSGTWVYDEAKSNKASKEIFKSQKKISNSKRKQINKFIIEHSTDMIKITETVLVEIFDESGKAIEKIEKTFPSKIYYTDKRGEQNTDEKDQPVESITQWKDKKILVTVLDKKKEQVSTISFSLSKDGQELKAIYLTFKSDGGFVSPLGFGDRVFNKMN
jgi:hypothetical protein